MQTRRHFLASAAALAAIGTASTPGFAGDAPVSDAELQRQMLGKLTNELNDRAAAADEAGYLFETFFLVDAADRPGHGHQHDCRIRFRQSRRAVVRRRARAGPRERGDCDAVFLLRQKVAARIFAQQEVASVLASKYGLTAGVTSIATPAPAAGSPIPTPDGVVTAIVRQAGSASALGNVGVVTHSDQASIAVRVSNAAGMQAAVPAGLTLPSLYDASAQMPALRRRDLYLLSNVGVQLGMLRLELINREYPNG